MVLEESFPGKEDNPTHGGFPLGGWVLGVSVLKKGGAILRRFVLLWD